MEGTRPPGADRDWLNIDDDPYDDGNENENEERTPLTPQYAQSRYRRKDADGQMEAVSLSHEKQQSRSRQDNHNTNVHTNAKSNPDIPFHKPFSSISNFLTSQAGKSFRSQQQLNDRETLGNRRTNHQNENHRDHEEKTSTEDNPNNSTAYAHAAFAMETPDVETPNKYQRAAAMYHHQGAKNAPYDMQEIKVPPLRSVVPSAPYEDDRFRDSVMPAVSMLTPESQLAPFIFQSFSEASEETQENHQKVPSPESEASSLDLNTLGPTVDLHKKNLRVQTTESQESSLDLNTIDYTTTRDEMQIRHATVNLSPSETQDDEEESTVAKWSMVSETNELSLVESTTLGSLVSEESEEPIAALPPASIGKPPTHLAHNKGVLSSKKFEATHAPHYPSLAHPGMTYLNSPYEDDAPSPSSTSTVSSLFGLSIHSPSSASGLTDIMTPSILDSRRVSFQIDPNYIPVADDMESQVSFRQHSIVDEQSDYEDFDQESGMHSRTSSVTVSATLWRVYSELINGEILRAADTTRNELLNIWNLTKEVTIRSLGLTATLQNWKDLDYLQESHRKKMAEILPINNTNEDHFEFVIVLKPQEVYAFWAELLDFRSEYLGIDFVASDSPESGEMAPAEYDIGETDGTFLNAPMTPTTGLRNRTTSSSPAPMGSVKATCSVFPGMLSVDTSRPALKRRQSLFERAFDSLSPSTGTNSSSFRSNRNLTDVDEVPTPPSRDYMKQTPLTSATRRRWGNRIGSTPDLQSPPVHSLHRISSIQKRRTPAVRLLSPSEETVNTLGKRVKRHPNAIRVQDIPTQVVPRGIAARTNGMERFLSALKRGIVVRRHRPNAEPVFCKLVSNDGGDTIQYAHVPTHEAMLAFKEQRVRYNPKLAEGSPGIVRTQSMKWINDDEKEDKAQNQHFSIPDHVAAEQYRHGGTRGKVAKKVVDLATKVAQNGTIRPAEVISIHPTRHEDPRSDKMELGTASFRKSKAEYHIPFSFSVIITASPWINGQVDITSVSEKWDSGKLSDVQFKCVDFEAATEGEYWLIFRGLLLLHRDACTGRFAKQRSAGFGNNIRREIQQHKDDNEEENLGNRLTREVYQEPHTLGIMEKLVSKLRKTDAAYTDGYVEPGAMPPPSDYFLGYRSPGTEIWSRLRQAGFETERIYGLDDRQVMLKLFCPSDRILDVAEVLRMKLKARDGSFLPFREENIALFPTRVNSAIPSSDGASVFTSSERQLIVDFIIRSRIRDSGAELGANTDLGMMVGGRVPLHDRKQLDTLCNAWIYYWRTANWTGRDGRSMSVGTNETQTNYFESEQSPFGTINSASLEQKGKESHPNPGGVPNLFSRFLFGSVYQPLDSVEQYFGEKVAFYFAWLQHCSFHLMFLSVLGLLVFIIQMTTGNWDHPIRPFFSTVVMLWSFVVLVKWRQRSNFLAHRWGTMNLKEQETTRPQFKGEHRKDEITGEWVVYYPSWKRYLKYLISFPLTMAFTIGTLIGILTVHANRDLLLASYFEQKENPDSEQFKLDFSFSAIGRKASLNAVQLTPENLSDPTFWIIIAGYPCALGLCLPLLNLILMRISVMLNNFENYRTDSEYHAHLIIKVFSFRFVCYFATLYYYAYVSIGTEQAIANGILRVGTGVAIYMTVAHWWGIFLSVILPFLLFRIRQSFKRLKLVDELHRVELEEFMLSCRGEDKYTEQARDNLINRRILLEQAQNDLWEEVVLREHDSFPEYIQAVVQFAWVTCFSVVLPIAPIICLINHMLSMRLDAYKLCRGRRRPLMQKTGGIGIWEHVLHIVSVIAVLTNCFLMGFASTQFKEVSDEVGSLGLFCIVVGWEHIMLLIKYVMQASISKLPKTVCDEIKKDQHDLTKLRNTSMITKKKRRSKRRKGAGGSKMSTCSHYEDDDVSLASSRLLLHDDTRSMCSVSLLGTETETDENRPPVRNVSANIQNSHQKVKGPQSVLKQAEARARLVGEFDSELGSIYETPYAKSFPVRDVGGIIVEDPSMESSLYEA